MKSDNICFLQEDCKEEFGLRRKEATAYKQKIMSSSLCILLYFQDTGVVSNKAKEGRGGGGVCGKWNSSERMEMEEKEGIGKTKFYFV